MPSSRTLNFSDPFPYQKALRLADVELLPTKKGEFRGELTQITFDKVWMQHGTESLPNVVAGTVKQIRQSITFASNDRETVYRGVNVLPGGIIIHKADFEHRRSEENNSWGSMSLAHADFDAACKAVLGLEFGVKAPQHVVRPDPATMSRLLDLHKTVGQIAKTSPDILELPEVALGALQQDLIHLMVRCLCDAEAAKISAGSLRHDLIIVKFEDFLKANPNTPLYLPEICAALGTAERSHPNSLRGTSLAWDQFVISPCGECIWFDGRSWLPILRLRSRELQPTTAFGSSDASRSAIGNYLESHLRIRCGNHQQPCSTEDSFLS